MVPLAIERNEMTQYQCGDFSSASHHQSRFGENSRIPLMAPFILWSLTNADISAGDLFPTEEM